MQLLFIAAFILMLFVTAGSMSERSAQRVASQSDSIARQFSMWHRAAYERCWRLGCAGGTVPPANVVAMLPSSLTGLPNSPYSRGWFTTRFDPTTRLLVTHMTPAFEPTAHVSFGTITAAMSMDSFDGDTSAAGFWSGTAIEPIRPPPSGSIVPPSVLSVPPGFMGVTIPSGSPIIANKL